MALGLLVAAGTLTACGGDDTESSSNSTGSSTNSTKEGTGEKSGKIALLLPESKTARYESQDRPNFEAKLKELCADCEILYSNADQDAAKQQQQAEAALTQGAKVIVLDAVDSASAGSIVTRANQQKVPVIAYDRLIPDAELAYYVTFDNPGVGKLQATALTEKLSADGGKGPIVMINGAPTTPISAEFKKGAHSVIDTSGLKVAKEFDTPDWSPDKAQAQMDQTITALGKDGFDGVYVANDGMAGGAIAAMKAAGIDPKTVPVTGQDAELPGIQRILAGEQYMTVYKAIKLQAEAAAQLAVNTLQGTEPPSGLVNGEQDNGATKVPSVFLKPVSVTVDNINDTVIKDGFWKASDICTAEYADACTEAGIQ
ncbi:substrate-binding domain-containing protein [Solirubrobacter taibaiensis]|nr:substrate-binding domain-containing protein [Solirubrobacter taibaiensis]